MVVRGRVRVRDYDDKDGQPRTAVDVDANSLGHDLSRGVANFQRIRPQTGLTAEEAGRGGRGTRGSWCAGRRLT